MSHMFMMPWCYLLFLCVFWWHALGCHITCCSLYLSCSQVPSCQICQPVNSMFLFARIIVITPCIIWTCVHGLSWSISCLINAHVFYVIIKVAMLDVMCLQSQHHNVTVLHPQIFTVWESAISCLHLVLMNSMNMFLLYICHVVWFELHVMY